MDDLDRRLAETHVLVQMLRARQDTVMTPRRVTFELHLPYRETPEELLTEARLTNYEVVSYRRGLLGSRLVLARKTAVDEPAASAFTRELVGLADRYGARFELWLPEPVLPGRRRRWWRRPERSGPGSTPGT